MLFRSSYHHLVAWCARAGDDRSLVVVNLSPDRADGLVTLPWPDLDGAHVRLHDVFTALTFERKGRDLRSPGLYVALGPWQFHVFDVQCSPLPSPISAA